MIAETPGIRAFLGVRAGPLGRDLDDLVQDVLARALRYQGRFDPQRDLGPWLRTLARRVLADQAPRRAPEAPEAPEPAARPRSGGVEDREEVQWWLRSLPRSEREVLVRFHAQGESLPEIAAALRLPLGTVKSHLHRARRRLTEVRRRTEFPGDHRP